MLSEGYHDLPPGHLAALVTYLQHDLLTLPPAPVWPQGLRLERLTAAHEPRYRALFRKVGAEWLWFGRLRLDAPALTALLADPAIEAFALCGEAGDIGLLELDWRDAQAPELAYLGLERHQIGRGLGRVLIAEALNRARARAAPHLMVHTCSFDAPGALAFYQRAGFRPYRRAVEVFRDPRLDGTLPGEATTLPLIA